MPALLVCLSGGVCWLAAKGSRHVLSFSADWSASLLICSLPALSARGGRGRSRRSEAAHHQLSQHDLKPHAHACPSCCPLGWCLCLPQTQRYCPLLGTLPSCTAPACCNRVPTLLLQSKGCPAVALPSADHLTGCSCMSSLPGSAWRAGKSCSTAVDAMLRLSST